MKHERMCELAHKKYQRILKVVSPYKVGIAIIIPIAIFAAIFAAGVLNTKQYEIEYTTTHHTDIGSARDAFDECLDTHHEGAITSVSFDTRLKATFKGAILKEGKYRVVCEYVWEERDALKK